MAQGMHDWIVFHRVRFATPINGTGAPLPGPAGATCWRFYPASPLGPDGMRTNVSAEWGGFGLYPSREAAEEVFAAPERHLPFLAEAEEAYHLLLVPYAHRGQVNWRGSVLDGETLAVAPEDPKGPLVVFTSAGYDNPGPEDVPRIKTFLREVDNVVSYYGTLPGNLRRAVYSGPGVDGHDGMTVSLWRSDAAMLAAAYKDGHHRDQMEYQRDPGHFDRSSFTRARVLSSLGSWDGADPVAELAS
ncbi:hypothetical protein [Jannaschia seohaensis]|uniref:Spheroidene monooxygenase n=1 Tax=Jannaschia seohaensis TaxID=475081 RepID=A0A2Y9C769_9RHOB|nr:hypothetical protein [Jannaschia seohaensis]PWJ20457.1 hypothetical protein BCF38_103275 [Jannaschia seohaensis]SSA44553.1 hypothetical protein SAMN05421539_103275 [Jannaschia seohaensis]